jgi:hypothetical protein
MKKCFCLGLIVILCAFTSTTQAAVLFSDLGTAAPPASISGNTLTPFDQVPQAAIVNGTNVTTIPGCPITGNLTTAANVTKQTIGSGWSSWSHGYTGVVYTYFTQPSTLVMNLPPDTLAFYFYAEPNSFGNYVISAQTNSGTSSGNISVAGSAGANGYAFYTTAGESIATITVIAAAGANGFAIGEFGIAKNNERRVETVPTMDEWGMIILSLLFLGISIRMIKQRKDAI